MPDDDKNLLRIFSFGFENLMTSRAHTLLWQSDILTHHQIGVLFALQTDTVIHV